MPIFSTLLASYFPSGLVRVKGLSVTAAIGLITVILTNAIGIASEGEPMTFQRVAKTGMLAFAGTVERLTYRRANEVVVTDVHFTDLKFVSGHQQQAPELVLTMQGGLMDGEEFILHDLPRFEVGHRYVVFAVDNGTPSNWYIPIVGLREGFFQIRRDPRTGRSVVHDWNGRPIIAIKGKHMAVLANRPSSKSRHIPDVERVNGLGVSDKQETALEVYPMERDPGDRLSEEELLGAARRISLER